MIMNEQSKYYEEYYSYILDNVKPKDNSKRIVFDIIYDLTDRRGLRQEFENIDGEIQDEIIDKWIEIIKKYEPLYINAK